MSPFPAKDVGGDLPLETMCHFNSWRPRPTSRMTKRDSLLPHHPEKVKKPELIKKAAPSPPLWIQTPQSWGSFFPSFLGGKLGVSEVHLTPHGHTHSSQPLSGPEVCLSTSKIQPFPTIDTCSGKDHSWSSSRLFSLRNGKSNGWLPWTTARSAGLSFLNLS